MRINMKKNIAYFSAFIGTLIAIFIIILMTRKANMSPIVRKSVRVLLLNDEKKLLLMCIEGFDISTTDGKKNERFWCTIGGGIEHGESLEQATLREIYEETGLEPQDISMGTAVWHGSVDLILKGKPTRLDETFIVCKTKQKDVALHAPTEDEKMVVKNLQWFSLEDIEQSSDTIFPILLHQYLPDILNEKYPLQPIEIDLNAKKK
jgi:8-oxo-dGTP pyrophosphatase MutT (NUDIX family)